MSDQKFNASRGRGELDLKLPKQSPKRRADKRGNGGPPFEWGPGGEAGRAATGDSDGGKMVKEVMAHLDNMSDEELNELYVELFESADPEDFEYEYFDDEDDDFEDEEIEVIDPFEGLEEEMYEAFKITNEDMDLSEFTKTVDAQDLSEEVKVSTKNIFEAVVVNTINERLETMCEALADYTREALEDREALIVARLDQYLDDTINEWLENNIVAIESGIRADIAENFMSNLKTLFSEAYIEIPEEKIDVASALAVKNDELMETLNRKQRDLEEIATELDAYRKRDAVVEVCADLSEAQMGKIYDLVENMVFEDEESFKKIVEDVRANAFPKDGTRSTNITEDFVPDNGGTSNKPELPKHVKSAFAMIGNAPKTS